VGGRAREEEGGVGGKGQGGGGWGGRGGQGGANKKRETCLSGLPSSLGWFLFRF
jgi:hypothetical protein